MGLPVAGSRDTNMASPSPAWEPGGGGGAHKTLPMRSHFGGMAAL
jgi:hypothetical protein